VATKGAKSAELSTPDSGIVQVSSRQNSNLGVFATKNTKRIHPAFGWLPCAYRRLESIFPQRYFVFFVAKIPEFPVLWGKV
jgi:hypothetical protein